MNENDLLLAEIEGLASAGAAMPSSAPRPLTIPEKILGYSRSYLAGPTFNLADEAEARVNTAIRNLFGYVDSSNFAQAEADKLEQIRREQARFKDLAPVSSMGTELVSGMILNPLDKLKKVMGAGSLVKTAITNPVTQAALAGFGAGEGGLAERAKSAAVSGTVGAAGSAAATSLGKIAEKGFREADRLKLSAYGIGKSDLNRYFKGLSKGDFAEPLDDIRILDVVKKAEAEDIIRPDGEVLENIKGVLGKQNQLYSGVKTILDEVDTKLAPIADINLTNTSNYIDKLSGTAREKAEEAAAKEIAAISKQIGSGTLDDLQRLKVGLNYKYDENPYTENIIKAIRSDLRQEIEDRVAVAADLGAIDPAKRNVVAELNKEWGGYEELYDVFKKKATSMYGGDIVEDAIGDIRTSGGVGSLINASAATGSSIPAAIGTILTAGRAPEAKAALGDILENYQTPLRIAGEILPEVGTARNIAQLQVQTKDRPASAVAQVEVDEMQGLLAEIEKLAGQSRSSTPNQQNLEPLAFIKQEISRAKMKPEENKTVLIRELANAGIEDPTEINQFLAQMEHESAGFKKLREVASGKNYEGRKDLGNTQKGDGERFKGRGFIQLTGRDNYKRFGDMLGIDLIKNPELAEQPEIAAKIAVAYWQNRVKPKIKDFNDVEAVTKIINGGLNGLQDRSKRFAKYKADEQNILALLQELASKANV